MLESESELVPMIRKPHQPPPRPSRGRLASPTRSPSDPTSSARASEKPVSHITRSKSCDEINERPLCRWIEIKNENYRRIKVQRHLTLAPRVFLAVWIWIGCEEMKSTKFRSSVHGQARLKAGWVTIPSICIPPLTSNPKLFHRTVEILFL